MELLLAGRMAQEAAGICARLAEAGHLAWFAGGCVRDALLGIAAKDIDIATDAQPQEVLRLFPGGLAVGAHFGVVVVRQGQFSFDVATFREDGNYSDGRRPESVSFAAPQRDAQRRDFTLNALFWDPQRRELVDFVGGEADLRAGVLRAVGEASARFAEDGLRLLRAVRFAARYGLEIEAETAAALRAEAAGIERISAERVLAELNRMWLDGSRVRALDLLEESGLMALVLPELTDCQGVEQQPQWHPEGDVYQHTRLVLSHIEAEAPLELAWAALLHDIGKPGTASWDEAQQRWRFNGHAGLGAEMSVALLRRLRAGNRLVEEVEAMVRHHMDFQHAQQMKESTLRRMMGRPTFLRELELHQADCLGSHGKLDNYEYLRAKLAEFSQRQAEVLPRPLLDGREVMALVGIEAGPGLGELLRELYDRQLEGELKTREAAEDWLRARVGG